ncbi:MAG TPA: hypothetical protein VGO43_08790 [Pyrinomonadaceae bacterium]|jgi:hypothetical protein|nr:hypothetical protein [Pyrinomonadaceae bacterium]
MHNERCPRCGKYHIPSAPVFSEEYRRWVEAVLADIKRTRELRDRQFNLTSPVEVPAAAIVEDERFDAHLKEVALADRALSCGCVMHRRRCTEHALKTEVTSVH